MRYTLTRLCGGEALLLTPREAVGPLRLEAVAEGMSREGVPAEVDGMMLIMRWKGMEVTLYENGKIMFYPLREKSEAIELAGELMGSVQACGGLPD